MRINTTATICPFCGVGCGLGLRASRPRDRRRSLALAPGQRPASLCAKGWNAAFGIEPGARVTTPLIREHGRLRPASWNEALDLVAGELKGFLSIDGPDALGVISSARATNEDNYAAQKFARVALGSPNIDHCARICHSPSVAGLAQTLGSGAMTNSMADAELADCILVWGADPTENHAVFGGRILRAKTQRNATLIVVDPRRNAARADRRHAPATEARQQHRARQRDAARDFPRAGLGGWCIPCARVDGVDALKAQVAPWTPARAGVITGVPADTLIVLPRAHTPGAGIPLLRHGHHPVRQRHHNVIALVESGAGLRPDRPARDRHQPPARPEQRAGRCDMGCLPNVYPGYQNGGGRTVRRNSPAPGVAAMPRKTGLTSLGMHARRTRRRDSAR
jgi:predicted molibdopterin-dependent oxidoreductase YjgC